MKYTYMGFSQRKMVEYGMDLVDAAILRYFIDFKDSGSMVTETVDKKVHYWVKYEALIEDAPILNIKSRDSMRRRFKKMVDAQILTHHHKLAGGSYSFYGIGENYKYLISDLATQKSEGCDSKVGGGTDSKSEGCDSKVGAKDLSTKDPSTKDLSTKKPSIQTSDDGDTSEELKQVMQKYQGCGFGALNIDVMNILEGLSEEYSNEWVIQAFSVCTEANIRTISYLRGILMRWRANGGMQLGSKSEEKKKKDNKNKWDLDAT